MGKEKSEAVIPAPAQRLNQKHSPRAPNPAESIQASLSGFRDHTSADARRATGIVKDANSLPAVFRSGQGGYHVGDVAARYNAYRHELFRNVHGYLGSLHGFVQRPSN
jgi:hypothetical protein